MKSKFIVASLSLLILGFATEATAVTKPAKCPSVNAISAVPFDKLERIDYSLVAFQFNHTYDTEQSWDFELGDIEVKNSNETLPKLASAMQSLVLSEGLTPFPDGSWVCQYKTNNPKVDAIAFTPSRGDVN